MINQGNGEAASSSKFRRRRARKRTKSNCSHPLFAYYAGILAGLQQALGSLEGRSRVIGITSCAWGEGVSTVAINLAAAAETLGQKVTLINGHLTRRPSEEKDEANQNALNYLDRSAEMAACVYESPLERSSARLIEYGHHEKPVEEAERGSGWFDTLRARYDLILVDLPPVEEFRSHPGVVSQLNGTILIVSAERPADEVHRAAEDLERSGIPFLGAVLNGVGTV